jgi:hypothetical protein
VGTERFDRLQANVVVQSGESLTAVKRFAVSIESAVIVGGKTAISR